MPIYEYRCAACRRRSSVFTRSMSATVKPVCEHCGSRKISRIFSRVAVHRAGDSIGGFEESSLAGVDENDPRSVAKWVRKMSREMGEPLDAEMEADLERLEAGDIPDEPADGARPDDEFADVD